MRTRKQRSKPDELMPEYDSALIKAGVRGKYYERAMAGTNLVLIEPEVFEVFPTGEAVNAALRTLIRKRRIRKLHRQPNSRAARRGSR